MGKMSKKASSNIISFVQAIDQKASKLTSYDEAWDIISAYGGITGNLITNNYKKKHGTVFEIIRESDESIIHKFEWSNDKVFCDGDWNWTLIFKDVLDYIIKNKIVKKPRSNKTQISSQISKISSKVNKCLPEKKNTVKSQENAVKIDSMNIEELKKKKTALYGRIRDWKIKGKDATELIKQYNKISELCKKK